jgi:hypothetical protein
MPNGSSSSSSLGDSAKARDADALLHAVGELGRRLVHGVGEPDPRQVVGRDLLAFAATGMREHAIDPERNVLACSEPREQRGRLEYHRAFGPGGRDLPVVEHDAAAGYFVEPGCHRQHGRLAAAGMADERNKLALAHEQVEPLDDGERSLRCRVGLLDLVELDVAVLGRARGRFAVGPRRAGLERYRDHVRQAVPILRGGGTLDADLHEVLRDCRAQALVGRAGVHLGAVARSRERNSELGTESRARAGVERHDAVSQQDRLVDVIGDEDDGLLLARPDRLDLALKFRAREGVEGR